jgi:hypothetical protein
MPGAIIPVFSRRMFDFDNVQSPGEIEFTLAKAIDVEQYTEGTLLVRVHAHNIERGASIEVIAKATAPSNEDPELDFVGATVVAVTVDVTVSAPALVKRTFTADPGERVTITVRGSQTSTAPVSCNAELSAELVVKS